MCHLMTCPSTSVPEAEYPGQEIANAPVPGPPAVAVAVKFTVEPSCSVPVPDTFTVFAPVLTDENPAVSDKRILAEVSRYVSVPSRRCVPDSMWLSTSRPKLPVPAPILKNPAPLLAFGSRPGPAVCFVYQVKAAPGVGLSSEKLIWIKPNGSCVSSEYSASSRLPFGTDVSQFRPCVQMEP